jgi:hypothetical protein
VAKAELDLPKASVQAEVERLLEGARADSSSVASRTPTRRRFPTTCSARRPSAACAWAWWWPNWCVPTLQAKPEQIKAHVEELAASYEKPADVMRWYFSDNRRMAEVEGRGDREQRHRVCAGQGQGDRESRLVRRADGSAGLNARLFPDRMNRTGPAADLQSA